MLFILGTYYVVPFTTGCKLKIAKSTTEPAQNLIDGGVLTAKCEAAVREMHRRWDVDLDHCLNFPEASDFFSETRGSALVCVKYNAFQECFVISFDCLSFVTVCIFTCRLSPSSIEWFPLVIPEMAD
jgi:hypothetical protein